MDFELDMEWVVVAVIVDIEEMTVEGMVVDIDTIGYTFAMVAGFHNHIPSNLVKVGFDIVVVAKPAMALVYSMCFEDIENFGDFVEGTIEAFLAAKVSLVPYSIENLLPILLLLAILLILDIFLLYDFMCIVHILVYFAKDIP